MPNLDLPLDDDTINRYERVKPVLDELVPTRSPRKWGPTTRITEGRDDDTDAACPPGN